METLPTMVAMSEANVRASESSGACGWCPEPNNFRMIASDLMVVNNCSSWKAELPQKDACLEVEALEATIGEVRDFVFLLRGLARMP